MSNFYLELHKATSILRNDDGVAMSWHKGRLIKAFKNPVDFLDYVRANAKDLKYAVAFTGSAGLIVQANTYIASERKKLEPIKPKQLIIDHDKEFAV